MLLPKNSSYSRHSVHILYSMIVFLLFHFISSTAQNNTHTNIKWEIRGQMCARASFRQQIQKMKLVIYWNFISLTVQRRKPNSSTYDEFNRSNEYIRNKCDRSDIAKTEFVWEHWYKINRHLIQRYHSFVTPSTDRIVVNANKSVFFIFIHIYFTKINSHIFVWKNDE